MILDMHEHFMRLALAEAKEAFQEGEIPVGAIVVCDNKVIAKDHNRVERLQDATAHAEILAVTAAQGYLNSKYLNECTMYVTLEPCSMCAGALFWTQLGSLYCGAEDTERGYSRHQEKILHPTTEVHKQLLNIECSLLISDFFKQIRSNKSN